MAQDKKLIRFMESVLDGNLASERALHNVKGIGATFSRIVCTTAGIDPKKKLSELSKEELESLEKQIKQPQIPTWLLNRRKDLDSGKDIHLTGAQLDLRRKEDINIMKRIRSYKGIRHEQGQPVRGQRTRSTFRSKKTVGVMKKAAKEAAAGKAKEEKKK